MTKGSYEYPLFRICALLSVLLLLLYDDDDPSACRWFVQAAVSTSSSSSFHSSSSNSSKTSKRGRGECIETDNDTYQCFSNTVAVICEDKEPQCAEWQQRNECQNNPAYMLEHCRKSCQSCIDGHGGISQVAPGNSAPRVVQRLVDTARYMATQHGQQSLASCRNDREECTFMAVEGKCGSEWMNEHCKAACRQC